MMLTVYLDTSVAVPLFVKEPISEQVAAWYGSCSDVIVSSDWIMTEFASALAIKERHGDLSAEMIQAAWTAFREFCGTGLRLVPVTRTAFAEAADMARNAASGLRSGDSLHLAIALEIGASRMATEDALLERNARANGMSTVEF
jgi:predicted nucleic acid-binding protein